MRGSGVYPLLKPAHWGLITSCRDILKSDADGNVVYKGAWFRVRKFDFGILAAIAENGIEGVQKCYNDCLTDDDTGSCLLFSCRLGLHFNGDMGSCYPARCSPAEILIATVDGTDVNNTSAYPMGVYGVKESIYPYNFITLQQVKYTDANNGLWVVIQIIQFSRIKISLICLLIFFVII